MIRYLLAVVVLLLPVAAAQSLEERVAELEERVAALEALLASPEAPPEGTAVDGFTFSRTSVAQRSTFAHVVGQISADREYASVEVRVVLYAADGRIVGTNSFYVDNVGPSGRTFDTLIPGVNAAEVDTIGFEIESTR